MFSIFFIFAGLVSIIVAFWSPLLACATLGCAEAIILFALFEAKSRSWKFNPDLSAPANAVLQKHGHFYTMPFAASGFCASAGVCYLASIVLGIIFGFKGEWFLVAVAAINTISMVLVSREFNPATFITGPLEQIAHAEIMSHITASQDQTNEL